MKGRFGFGFHFDLSEENFDALAEAKEACGDLFPLPEFGFGEGFPFGEDFELGDELPFGDDFPFKRGFGGGILDFGFGFGVKYGFAEVHAYEGTIPPEIFPFAVPPKSKKYSLP